jgi:hypothetical protein
MLQQILNLTTLKIGHAKLTQTGPISVNKHQAPPSELDDGEPTYMNSRAISDDLFYQPDTGIKDSTTVRGSAREDEDFNSDSGMPEVPDTTAHQGTPLLPPIPQFEAGGEIVRMPEPHWTHSGYVSDIQQQTPPWQLIHQRLQYWAMIWPMSELDDALESTTSGHQVNEISLSIWVTQIYKRYVRSRMTDSPQGKVDQLFVPPNVADAVNTAVSKGRHGDACMMLRDLWASFGLDGFPKLLIVLAKHREDANHWVVHRCVHPPSRVPTRNQTCVPG